MPLLSKRTAFVKLVLWKELGEVSDSNRFYRDERQKGRYEVLNHNEIVRLRLNKFMLINTGKG